MTAKKLFSKNITYLVEKHRLDAGSLAAALGTSNQRVRHWLNGHSAADPDMLVELSDYFDIGIDNLLTIDLRNICEQCEAR